MAGSSTILLIIAAVFAVMFAMLYVADQSGSAILTRPELSESEIRELLTVRLNEEENVEQLVFAVDHPRADDRHFPLFFYGLNETLYRINSTDFSILGKCVTSAIDSCPVSNPLILSEIKGRLTYFVEVSIFTGPEESSSHRYFIDAMNGKILYSD